MFGRRPEAVPLVGGDSSINGPTSPLSGSSGASGASQQFYFLQQQGGVENGAVQRSLEPEQNTTEGGGRGWWPFGWGRGGVTAVAPFIRPRKVPVKIEPKVFFANERTFLAWLHMSVTLASISIAIIAFAEHNEWSQVYGLLILPVAILFCMYALYNFLRRSSMIRRRDPGPYDDALGPSFLALILMVSIILNFSVKIYDMYT
uniref:DUF202 domain-containing protein n=1 Tax=Fibrocapsa japonica TaxID=94617 RepID=A0A7S2V667_9STRA|mmetsp:Transcript_4850/g.7290  ORF Transcript_4850/g.7290 Transcript_4850/m.7290 type:complete len:203 (+) Transcript_4850:233-841(+)|eukprot:CAMPEP_0113952050 /NCGR_PEP_ID=MMETSP1339-20121228/89457_1 /TAXON_ID=94617 /ORGANISM="Fibrocapsa japonica" /LENGTH=202 /DNA_ID=CAMNT_0000960559 /DNA_START=51 /DNA_END=659 /DNA_ORIENTATION=- /assembly_acc=CAM_ASM_000762